jgi:hypothetical protein
VLAAKVPAGDGWLHELKHDGFRIVALKDGNEIRLWSRNGRNWSVEFAAITAAVISSRARDRDGKIIEPITLARQRRRPPLGIRWPVSGRCASARIALDDGDGSRQRLSQTGESRTRRPPF